jgi:hypothetical protein
VNSKAPSKRAIASELGSAQKLWDGIVATLSETYGSVDQEWKPSKAPFGWICLLKHKNKTLVYLTPEKPGIRVAIVLGERAVALALASRLPGGIKSLIKAARPYAEGRGIRFPVVSAEDVPTVIDLVAIKTSPK